MYESSKTEIENTLRNFIDDVLSIPQGISGKDWEHEMEAHLKDAQDTIEGCCNPPLPKGKG